MAFLISCLYRPGGANDRFAVRTSHIAYMIDALPDTIAGGPLLDEKGDAIGMFVLLRVPHRELAERFMAFEPYNQAALFQSVQITATKIMVPEATPGSLREELARQMATDAVAAL